MKYELILFAKPVLLYRWSRLQYWAELQGLADFKGSQQLDVLVYYYYCLIYDIFGEYWLYRTLTHNCNSEFIVKLKRKHDQVLIISLCECLHSKSYFAKQFINTVICEWIRHLNESSEIMIQRLVHKYSHLTRVILLLQ